MAVSVCELLSFLGYLLLLSLPEHHFIYFLSQMSNMFMLRGPRLHALFSTPLRSSSKFNVVDPSTIELAEFSRDFGPWKGAIIPL
ncbi:hypothetical protein V8C35DRAFT_289312 [Trichoderma chlorosporum]